MNLPKVYAVSMTAASSQSASVDLKACYRRVLLQTPVFASGGTHYIQGSLDGTNYFRFWQDFTASGAATVFQIIQGASAALIPIPAGVQHYKIENTSGISNGATFQLVCFD